MDAWILERMLLCRFRSDIGVRSPLVQCKLAANHEKKFSCDGD